MALDLYAKCRVSDFEAALPWYKALLGAEPTFRPHEREAVWTLADNRHLVIEQYEGSHGGGDVTVMVDDLDERVAGIAARGIEPAGRETYTGARKVIYRDADGNEVSFGTVDG